VNGLGVITIATVNSSVIQVTSTTISNISISSTTNGAFSINGNVSSLAIDGVVFDTVGTGNNGGAVYLNILEYTDSTNSLIQNSIFVSCSAVYGGGLYINGPEILLYNDNFSNNTASQAGNDIFENKTSSGTYYNSLTVQFCCSDSEGVTISLSDNTDLSGLLPPCIPPSGERYIGSASGYDTQNSCLNQNTPCLTLANAISSGQASLEQTISITVLGEHEETNLTIVGSEVIHIHSPQEIQSMVQLKKIFFFFLLFFFLMKCIFMYNNIYSGSIKFKSTVSANTALWTIVGAELEARGLKFLHGASSKGAFIRISSGGIIVINGSEITAESSGYIFF
jgi:hypothetical protein